MKNSEKKSPKPPKLDAGFAERTGVLKSLRNQFPDVIEKMITLLITANEDCERYLHQFAFELDGIFYLYGRRLKSPIVNYDHPDIERHSDYLANQHNRRDKLENAVQALAGLKSDLCQLDARHSQEFCSSYKSPIGPIKYKGPLELIAEIELAARIVAACQGAYSSVFEAPVSKRGRRPLPYVDATGELIQLWERYTGEQVPVSKTHQHQVTTNAANFIRLGISLIDPTASDANVVTAINNARSKSS